MTRGRWEGRAPALMLGIVVVACSEVRIVEPADDADGGASSSSSADSNGGATTSLAGGSGGASEPCTPGIVESCYEGPAETLNVGVCASGTRVCAPDGQFGPCQGQTLPAAEDCSTLADESCDGQGCPGELIWASELGGEDEFWQDVTTLAVDPFDNVLVAGGSAATLQIGGEWISGGSYLAKLDSNGSVLWSRAPGMAPVKVKSDPVGNVILTGSFFGVTDLGGGPVGTTNENSSFVVKLDANGDYLWSSVISGSVYPRGLATDAEGAVFVGGGFAGTLQVDGQQLTATGPQPDIYLLKLDASGDLLWARAFGDEQPQELASLDVTPLGQVVFAGDTWGGTFDLGGDMLAPSGGTRDLLLAELDGSGDHVWSHRFGGGTFNDQPRLVVDATGSIFIAGSFSEDLDFGNDLLTGTDDVYLAQIDETGAPIWSRAFTGGPMAQRATAITLSLGGPVIAGFFAEQIDLGGDLFTVQGTQTMAAFLGRYLPDGSHHWSRAYGEEYSNDAHIAALATDSNENILVAGDFIGTVDLGGGQVTGSNGIFIAKIAP